MSFVLPNGKLRRNYKVAREGLPLMQRAREIAVIQDVSSRPGAAACIAHAMDEVQTFENPANAPAREVDFCALYQMSASAFGVPDSFECDIRYQLTVDGSAAFFDSLDKFTDTRLSGIEFPGVRRVYTNLTIRLLLRALIAIHGGFCPYREY